MPSVSQKQHDFMKRAIQDKEYAKKRGVSQEIAKEFIEADKKVGLWERAKLAQKQTIEKL